MPEPIKLVIPYKPQPHQMEWHRCKTRFLVVVTGRQIGKTTAIVNDAIRYAATHPNERVWYVTNDYGQAKRNVWSEFKRYLPIELGVKYNGSELSMVLPNNARIELIGVENAESLRGAVVHRMYLDEYKDFPSNVWPEILRPMLSTTEGGVWFMGTPKGFNHFYELYDLAGSHPSYTRHNIPSAVIENGSVTSTTNFKTSVGEIQEALDTLPDNVFRQEYLGEFTKPSGTVYDEWNVNDYRPCPYDPLLPIHVSMDFGVNDPTAIGFLQPCQGEIRLIKYYEASDAQIASHAAYIRAQPFRDAELYTGDAAGKARNNVTSTSPIAELAKLGIHVRTKDGLRIIDQIRLTHGIMKRFVINSEDPGCARFKECILNYRYPEKKETAINQENEIPIHDEYSHGMRMLEYYVANYGDVPVRERKQVVGRTPGMRGTGYGSKPVYGS